MARIFPTEWIFPKTQKDIHMLSVKSIEKKFAVEIDKGLSWKRAHDLQERHGKNRIEISYASVFRTASASLVDSRSLLLLACFSASLLMFALSDAADWTGLVDALLVLACLLANSGLIALQEYKTIKWTRLLQSMDTSMAWVLREGVWSKIPVQDLVVGDVVEIRPNEYVPADLRLVSANNLRLDKSILTGESEPAEGLLNNLENIETKINYFEAKNMAFTNFLVFSGYGQGIVVSVGNQSYTLNNILARTRSNRTTNNSISRSVKHVVICLVATAVLISLAYVIIWLTWLRTIELSWLWSDVFYNALDTGFTGVPIGLPVALSAGLYFVARRLRKNDIIVKHVDSLLSASNIDVVLTDKTGTLTRNTVEVTNVFCSTTEVDIEACMQPPDSGEVYIGSKTALEQLLDLCDFCTHDSSQILENVLLKFALENRPGTKALGDMYDVLNEIEFNSNIKYQVKLVKAREERFTYNHYNSIFNSALIPLESPYTLMVRGAHDFLLPKCKYILNEHGLAIKLNQASLKLVENKINQWSLMGRRLIIFCKKTFLDDTFRVDKAARYNRDFEKWFNLECNDLVFVGIIGFIDPPKPE